MPQSNLKIATRGSQLALWQSNWIRQQLLNMHSNLDVELVVMKTTGDRIQNRPLAQIGGKGLFVKELETALLEGKADLAVHSMKDVPGQLPKGLEISVITKREDSSDALVAPNYKKLDDLPQGAIIGTSSLRRASQLKSYRRDFQTKLIRGNVETRLRKVKEGIYDATILATAGLKRLNLEHEITQVLPFSIMLPAIAQGAIGIETRKSDIATLNYIKDLHDPDTSDPVIAERTLLSALEGNCQIPLAGNCIVDNYTLHLTGIILEPDGRDRIQNKANAPRHLATSLGNQVSEYLLNNGGREILKRVFSSSQEPNQR